MEMVNKSASEFVWPGRITQVIDPHYFWMQLGTRENLFQFEQFQNELQKFAHQGWAPAKSADELEPGMVVLVDTNAEDQTRWKRGQVAGIMHGNAVDVFYVDYGNTELTTVDRICLMMPNQFKAFPPQAVRCSLAGVKPLVKKWTSRGIKTFQHLTGSGLLNVLVLYGEPGYCEIALYPSEEENGRSIGHCLVAEEVATFMEEQLIPEFLQDIPTFMTQGYQDMSPNTDSSAPNSSEEHKTEVNSKALSTSPSTEKYIPPHQKNLGSSPGSAGSGLSNHSTVLQSSPSDTSGQKYSNSKSSSYSQQFSGSKLKEPVNDFFPFENVSVYPPSPSSPIKSPGRTAGRDQSDQGQSGSYFSRPPKYDQYGTNSGYRERNTDRYSSHAMSNEGYGRQQYSGQHHEKNRFAANFDNLPQPPNTFEPNYLNHNREKNSESQESYKSFTSPEKTTSGLHRSPNKSLSDSNAGHSPRSRPRLHIPGSHPAQPPFYPPDQKGEVTGSYAAPKTWNQPPPQTFDQSHPHYGLHPPSFYQHNFPPPPLIHPDQYFNQQDSAMSPGRLQASAGSSPIKVPQHNHTDHRHIKQLVHNSYHEPGYRSEQRHGQDYPYKTGSLSNTYVNQYYNQNNSNLQESGKPPLKVQSPSTSKYGYEPPKLTPESPESPAIAAFNLGDLEHTQMTSTDHFHQQLHQERLQALQEEAEDIARESKEQSKLVNISRYGSRGQHEEIEDYTPVSDQFEVYDQIAQEIQNTSLHNPVDVRRSPVKTTGIPKVTESTVKLEGIPQSYIADVDFTEAVKEALEFGKADMDNAKLLLRDIVESLRTAKAEKQVCDVILLMLAKAVKEYDLFCLVVMETINNLNGEMEIKESLAKALKRQQELSVRVPVPSRPLHLHFARVMGHIFNMVLEWNDSNASILDGILVTIEKWIVFNSRGTQIGQLDKENVFLDCFGAFWEVSGTKVMQHNQTFRSRIREEIRTKLLNENVSRCIRERLLDIMLQLFSHNVERHDVTTQTRHRTMIPSSCQVKPTTCDKATFMESEWQDEGFTNLDPDKLEMNWQIHSDYASPDPSLSLRPKGRGQGTLCSVSTPHDSFGSSRARGTPNTQDLSRLSDLNESVYVTPNESLVSKSDKDDTQIHDNINRLHEISSSKLRGTESANKILGQSFGAGSVRGDTGHNGVSTWEKGDLNTEGELKNGNFNQSCSAGQTVSEQKGGMGRSLVDWFDYEPSGTEGNKIGAKLEEKRLETRKKLDSTSMEIIENDVALKYAPTKDLSKKKSKKDKDKKGAKSTSNVFGDNRIPESNKVVDNGAFEHDLQQAIIESLQNNSKDIASKTEKVIKTAEKNVDKDIDWWGVGEAADSRYFAGTVDEPVEDNLYIDNGPDVIIEDEFEQSGDELEHDQSQSNKKAYSESSEVKNGENQLNSESDFKENVKNSFEDTEIKGHDIFVRKGPDEFAFDDDDVDDDDEQWDSESSEDLNVNDWVGLQENNSNYKEDFPEINLETVSPSRTGAADKQAESTADLNYEKNFPKTNFGDFIPVSVKADTEVRPSTARWVPGRRKCLKCHSEDHTTGTCKDPLILQ